MSDGEVAFFYKLQCLLGRECQIVVSDDADVGCSEDELSEEDKDEEDIATECPR